jgi:HEPN domain-containing protein
MENYSESERWMKDARDCFARAQRCFNEKDWRGTIQNAQLTIELSVKGLIAQFEEPAWTHSPDDQVKKIIEDKREELENKFGPRFLNSLFRIIEDIRASAPWHGWSVYGKERENGTGWISAVELCKEDTAKDLVKRAQRTLSVVEKFLKVIEE